MPDDLRRHRGGLDPTVLRRLVDERRTVREIAVEVGRSPTTVRYWLRRYDLRTSGRTPSPARVLTGTCATHGEVPHARAGGQVICSRCRTEAVSRWRRRAKEILVAEAGGRCTLCGYDRYVGALQFHHVDPATKSFAVGGRGLTRSLDALRAEAAKCVLLCATCHAEVEAGFATLPPERPDRG